VRCACSKFSEMMIWVRTPVPATSFRGAAGRLYPGAADDEDLPDETVYPGHALTDRTAGQRSDRFYFINFPAGDGLSAGVEGAGGPRQRQASQSRRHHPPASRSEEAAKPGWGVECEPANPRPLGAIPGSGERSTVVGNGPAEKAGDAEARDYRR